MSDEPRDRLGEATDRDWPLGSESVPPIDAELEDAAPKERRNWPDPDELSAAVSDAIVGGMRDVAMESDRQLLLALEELRDGARWAEGRLSKASRYLRSHVLRIPQRDPQQRIRGAILAEAKRAGLDPERADLQTFSEEMALLIHLVLLGRVEMPTVMLDVEEGQRSAEVIDAERDA